MSEAGSGRDVPGVSGTTYGGPCPPETDEETGVQDSPRGQTLTPILDPDSPFLALKPQDAGKGYVKVQMTGHPLAMKDGRIRLHRLVLFAATQGEDQACTLCGLNGLNWLAPPDDKARHLTVDHVNSNRLDNRLSNLRATHKWCNENRYAVEQLKIPWAFIAGIPVLDRKPCWNHVLGCPTPNAYAYQRRAQGEQSPDLAPPRPTSPEAKTTAAEPNERTPWDALFVVPASLLEKYAFLAEVKP